MDSKLNYLVFIGGKDKSTENKWKKQLKVIKIFMPYKVKNCSLFSDVHLLCPQIDLMPHDVITQLLRVLAIETKQEKAIINAEPTDGALSGLEAFSFDYIVKWPLSLIINRFHLVTLKHRFFLISNLK